MAGFIMILHYHNNFLVYVILSFLLKTNILTNQEIFTTFAEIVLTSGLTTLLIQMQIPLARHVSNLKVNIFMFFVSRKPL